LKAEIELSNDIDYTDNSLHNTDQFSNKSSHDVSVKVLKEENRGLKKYNIDKQGQIDGLKEKN